MEKTLLFVIAIFLIITCIVSLILINKKNEIIDLKRYNGSYEKYVDKEILGIDLASLINQVVNENEKNDVQKNQNGYYIDNGIDSIKIDLKMITIDQTFEMEDIHNSKISNFVKFFNSIKFKCTDILYHDNGRVSKLIFEELP